MTMRKLITLAACAGMLLSLGATAARATNILTNGDFETGDLTGWQVFGVSANSNVMVQSPDNGPALPGLHNAYMDNRAEALGLTLKQTTVPGSAMGGIVYYSFDLKLGQAANGGVFFVQIFAERSGVGIVGGSGLLGNYTPADWTTFSGSFVAPAGADFLTIQFMANTGAVTGSVSTMHVDNVILSQEPIVPGATSSWGNVKGLYR